MSEQKKEYEIGYGKPPRSGQFKKGRSGNPKGRSKGSRGLKTDLKAELSEKVTISENGKRRKLSKQRLLIKQLSTKALKGDIRAISKLADLAIEILGVEDELVKGPVSVSLTDKEILKDFARRILDGSSDDG